MVGGSKVNGAKLAGVFVIVVGFALMTGLSGATVGAGVGAAYYAMKKRRSDNQD